MSYGNSPSTVRQFRRVSPNSIMNPNAENEDPNSSVVRTPQKAKVSLDQLVDMDSSLLEGSRPGKDSGYSSTVTTLAAESKEASFGRRLYANAIGISCQDVLNDTADEVKREAVARLAEAFSDLESVDPDGMYHIMQTIITKMKQDDTLKDMLPQSQPQPSPPLPRTQQSPQKTSLSSQQQQPISANASRQVTPSTPTGKGNLGAAKLVLAQNNPHLKSHRRRQSAQVVGHSRSREGSQAWPPTSPVKNMGTGTATAKDEDAELEREMIKGFADGLEHTRQLSDVLFGRWCEGLRVRWPAV